MFVISLFKGTEDKKDRNEESALFRFEEKKQNCLLCQTADVHATQATVSETICMKLIQT